MFKKTIEEIKNLSQCQIVHNFSVNKSTHQSLNLSTAFNRQHSHK